MRDFQQLCYDSASSSIVVTSFSWRSWILRYPSRRISTFGQITDGNVTFISDSIQGTFDIQDTAVTDSVVDTTWESILGKDDGLELLATIDQVLQMIETVADAYPSGGSPSIVTLIEIVTCLLPSPSGRAESAVRVPWAADRVM